MLTLLIMSQFYVTSHQVSFCLITMMSKLIWRESSNFICIVLPAIKNLHLISKATDCINIYDYCHPLHYVCVSGECLVIIFVPSIFKWTSLYINLYGNLMGFSPSYTSMKAGDYKKPFLIENLVKNCLETFADKWKCTNSPKHQLHCVGSQRKCAKRCVCRLSATPVYSMLSNVSAISFRHDWTSI